MNDSGATLPQFPGDIEASRELSAPRALAQHPDAPTLPGYILVHAIGRGAYAQVWRAWQVRTRRWVAVKVFERARGVDWLLLQREMDLLVRLEKHPNVVTLLDANLAEEPVYYTMDLLEHGSLARWVGGAEPAPLAAIETWMTDIATAVRYVHGKGLIHCDLKPANVLVDEDERVRVADFGQARLFHSAAASLGTLFYMAPEQARSATAEAAPSPDPRWDVYALGATIFALLTGAPPHADAHTAAVPARPLREELEVYADEVVHDPMTRLATALAGRCDRDFAAIVLKCLAPAPADRYAGMDGILADLRARRQRRPVSPLAGSRTYRAGLFFRRNAVAVTLAVLALGVVATALRIGRTGSAQDLLMLRAQRAADRGELPVAAVYWAELNVLAPSHLARANALACLAPPSEAMQRFALPGGTRTAALAAGGAAIIAGQDDGEAVVFAATSGRKQAALWRGAGRDWHGAVALSPDGRRAAAVAPREFVLWNLAAATPSARILGLAGTIPPAALAFSADGRRLAAAADRTVRIWNAASGRAEATLHHLATVTCLAFDPRTRRLATGTTDRFIRFWDPATGAQEKRTLRSDASAERIAFSPDGTRLAVASTRRTVAVWDLAGARAPGVVRLPASRITGIALSPDAATLLTGDGAGVIRCWDALTGEPIGRPLTGAGGIACAAFAADGRSATLVTLGAPAVLQWRTGWLVERERPQRLRARVQTATGLRLDKQGALVALTTAERDAIRQRAAPGAGGVK